MRGVVGNSHPFSIMTIPMTPDDFTDAQKQQPALVNDDADNFFNGVFTEPYKYYMVRYRQSNDAQHASQLAGISRSGIGGTFKAPTYEAFQVLRTADFKAIEAFIEPEWNYNVGHRTLFYEETILGNLLTADFRPDLTDRTLFDDDKLNGTPYTWEFIVRQRTPRNTMTWDDVVLVNWVIDGTGLMKGEDKTGDDNYPQGGLVYAATDSHQINATLSGGDAFYQIFFNNTLTALDWKGVAYTGANSNKHRGEGEEETPPNPVCHVGDTYDSASGLCTPSDPFGFPYTPSCPSGWTWNATTKTCERSN